MQSAFSNSPSVGFFLSLFLSGGSSFPIIVAH